MSKFFWSNKQKRIIFLGAILLKSIVGRPKSRFNYFMTHFQQPFTLHNKFSVNVEIVFISFPIVDLPTQKPYKFCEVIRKKVATKFYVDLIWLYFKNFLIEDIFIFYPKNKGKSSFRFKNRPYRCQ